MSHLGCQLTTLVGSSGQLGGGEMNRNFEERVRLAAFAELRNRQAILGEVLPYREGIQPPLRIDGLEIPLMTLQKGIHKPARLDVALSVVTAAPKPNAAAPYDDRFDAQHLLRYHYRDAKSGSPAAHRQAEAENAAVRLAMSAQLPIIYFYGVRPSRYLPFFPVYVVGDHRESREFSLDLTGIPFVVEDLAAAEAPEREYRSRVVKERLHQAGFRESVMSAYENHCAVCRLRRTELVEAAHIVPDSLGGPPVVTNGMAMCKLHHAAFDRQVLGVRPDLTVAIRADVLEEVDGPMLTHGLQDFHNRRLLHTPKRTRDLPGTEFLERRWAEFEAA
jgi:putative restriction endonuclease